MTKYVAVINTPGYLPDSDEPPPVFDTAQEAWRYLADERLFEEDAADAATDVSGGTPSEHYSDTASGLDKAAADPDYGEGTIYGDTPGYTGSHDLGKAYSVQVAEEE